MAREEPQETGHRQGYERVSLKKREEPRPGGGNQVDETSMDVDTWPGEWKPRKTIQKSRSHQKSGRIEPESLAAFSRKIQSSFDQEDLGAPISVAPGRDIAAVREQKPIILKIGSLGS